MNLNVKDKLYIVSKSTGVVPAYIESLKIGIKFKEYYILSYIIDDLWVLFCKAESCNIDENSAVECKVRQIHAIFDKHTQEKIEEMQKDKFFICSSEHLAYIKLNELHGLYYY
jgi:hypothetical protein